MVDKRDVIINYTLYYYINNSIAYNTGVVEIEDGKYIYVRSNGALVTGKYWRTNVNEYDVQGYLTSAATVSATSDFPIKHRPLLSGSGRFRFVG